MNREEMFEDQKRKGFIQIPLTWLFKWVWKKLSKAFLIVPLFVIPASAEYKQFQDGKRIIEIKDAFPIGIYHVSHTRDAKRLADMPEIAKMGFDYIATPLDTADKPTNDLAEALNLGLMVEYNADPKSVVEAFKASQVLFAHIPGDDVDIKFKTVEAYRLREAEYKALRGDLLTLASNALAINGGKFPGISDKTGQQCYPISAEPLSAVGFCYERTKAGCDAAGVPFIAHVQTSRWAGRRYPTPAEFYAMAWAALAFGANEILMYTYYDPDTDLATQPALRAEIERFIQQVRLYEKFLMFGIREKIRTSTGVTGIWRYPAMKKQLRVEVKYSPISVSISMSNL